MEFDREPLQKDQPGRDQTFSPPFTRDNSETIHTEISELRQWIMEEVAPVVTEAAERGKPLDPLFPKLKKLADTREENPTTLVAQAKNFLIDNINQIITDSKDAWTQGDEMTTLVSRFSNLKTPDELERVISSVH